MKTFIKFTDKDNVDRLVLISDIKVISHDYILVDWIGREVPNGIANVRAMLQQIFVSKETLKLIRDLLVHEL